MLTMSAYILRRLLFMIPTMFGIMLVSFVVVQFAPGGPVERVIAQLSGTDTGATSRISGSPAATSAPAAQLQGGAQGDINSKYRGAQGLDPEFIKSLEKQFGFDKPAYRALLPHAVELSALRFRQELFPRRQRARADQGEAAGLDLARALDDADDLSDLDPARHPQGGERRLAVRRLDLGRHHRRLCHSGLSVRDPAHHRCSPAARLPSTCDLSAARADLGQLGAAFPGGTRSTIISGT